MKYRYLSECFNHSNNTRAFKQKMVMDILAMKTRDGEPGLYAAWKIITLCVSHGSSLKFMESR